MKRINVVVFGATGSIGNSTLSIIRKNSKKFSLQAITCNRNYKKLFKIAHEFDVKKLGVNNKNLDLKKNESQFKLIKGIENFSNLVSKNTDVIIFAISGIETTDLILKLVKLGKKIGLANKECIISLGENLMNDARKYNTSIVPLDSEHNSIFHLLMLNSSQFKSITITASGGPFINLDYKKFNKITVKQAISHPIWKMGKKISVDSATMMNKALELIEAKILFKLKLDEINAIVHPQAVVHALINYKNGISTALLNKPNMETPIASLFFGFQKYSEKETNLDLTKISNLEFIPIDQKKFPAIKLGYEVMKMGGLAPNVFNYLNQLLVNHFLNGFIKFIDIVELNEINLEKTFAKNKNIINPSYEDIKNINNWIDKNIYLGN